MDRISAYNLKGPRFRLYSPVIENEKSRIKRLWEGTYLAHRIELDDFYEQFQDLKKRDSFEYQLALETIEDSVRQKIHLSSRRTSL